MRRRFPANPLGKGLPCRILLVLVAGALALLVMPGTPASGGSGDPPALTWGTDDDGTPCPVDPDGNCIWQCMDGVDNLDPEDTIADWPNDPGCATREDDDETNAPQPPPPPRQCADGLDNDGDGRIDMADPGCANPADDNEANDPAPPPGPPPPPPPPPPAGDRTPPTVPGAFRVTGTSLGRIEVAWNASSDNVGVAGYRLYLSGTATTTTTATSTTFAGLVCGTAYTLGVDAFDAAGNRSARATIKAATAPCPPFVDDTVVEEETSETTHWQAGYGQLYLDGLTDPGGDRGTRSKEGCRTAQHTETRRSFVQGVLYRARLIVSWCWRSVWSSVQKRHVPEVYDNTSSCNQLDVHYGIVIDKSCGFPQTVFFGWNNGPRGKAVTTAEGLYKNCFEGIPFISGCLPWQWHHLLTITAYGNGTWSKS